MVSCVCLHALYVYIIRIANMQALVKPLPGIELGQSHTSLSFLIWLTVTDLICKAEILLI